MAIKVKEEGVSNSFNKIKMPYKRYSGEKILMPPTWDYIKSIAGDFLYKNICSL